MKYSVILLAAGKGSRTHLDYNKVFYHLDANTTVLDRSLSIFEDDPDCEEVILVAAPYELSMVEREYGSHPKVKAVSGGETRQDSVWNGLQAAEHDIVMIHDAARPFLSRYDLDSLKRVMETEKAALLMVPSVDTQKLVDDSGYVMATLPRNQVWNAQTPQAFDRSVILDAHRKAKAKSFTGTDDAQLVERFSHVPVACVKGSPENTKITNPNDLEGIFMD